MPGYVLGRDDPEYISDAGIYAFNIKPVTDAFMGDFHQQCLAREFNIFGTIETEVKWHD